VTSEIPPAADRRAVRFRTGAADLPQEPKEETEVRVFTVEQAAEVLQVGRDTVYLLIRTRQLSSIKIGKLRRITTRQLADFIESLEEGARDGADHKEGS
jgi:excisionase family DNA binding protein